MNMKESLRINLQLFADNMDWLKTAMEKAGLDTAKFDDIKASVEANYKGFVPKSRFDEVNDQKKEYKQLLDERTTQLTELKGKVGDNKELEDKIKELETANANSVKALEDKLKQQAFEFALANEIKAFNVREEKALLPFLDMEKIKLEGDKIIGLKEQVEPLQKDKAWLFNEDNSGGGTGSGGNFKRSNPKGGEKSFGERLAESRTTSAAGGENQPKQADDSFYF